MKKFIIPGIPELSKAESVSVCLPSEYPDDQCKLAIMRDGERKRFCISKTVAAELIAAGFPYER